MSSFFSYENAELLYRLSAALLIAVGVAVSITAFLFDLQSSGKEEEEQKKLIKKYKRTVPFFSLITILLLLLEFFQVHNVDNDVFNGKYLYKGQTSKKKADGSGVKYFQDGCIMYEGDFKLNVFEGTGKLYTVYDKEKNLSGDDLHAETGDMTEGNHKSILRYEGEFHNGLYEG